MSVVLDRFNWIAGHYDLLARIVFGNALHRSQVCFLNAIPDGSVILIIGGGTGRILKPLLQMKATCQVWYVEASGKMISMAREKLNTHDLDRIRFIHGTEGSIPAEIRFDFIITHFFLDLFSEAKGSTVGKGLYDKLNNNGYWYASDFVNGGKWWHRLMLWLMYRFFGLTGSIEAVELPPWENLLTALGMVNLRLKIFYGGFIKSMLFRKLDNP